MGAKKWQKPKSYTVLLKFYGGGSDETQAFLEDFASIKGCSYQVVKNEMGVMPDFQFVTLTIDHNQHKTKEIIEREVIKEVVIRGGRHVKQYDYTVGEVFKYCENHNQQEAARNFGIPYRSFQRYISRVKARGRKPEDNWNADNNDLFVKEDLETPKANGAMRKGDKEAER